MVIDGFTLFGSWPGLPYDHPVEMVQEGLKSHGLDRACTLSSKGIFFDADTGNEVTWSVCRQDSRLIPIGVIDPRLNGEAQVERCREQGFNIVALFPVTQQWSLTGIPAKLVFRRLAEANLPLFIEAGREGDASALFEALEGVETPVILLDVSLHTLAEAMTVLRMRPRTYLSTRLLCGGDTIEMLSAALGAERLIFTSRFPISCFSSAFLTAKYAAIKDAERQAIMGGNLAALLGE